MKSFWLCSTSILSAATLAAIAPSGWTQPAPPANIQPDASLPAPSQVTNTADGTVVTGGTTAGKNLFHSFSEFSVPPGGEARFVPGSAAIDAIVTRVTGDLASQIDGTLAVEGNASLFLLNPNGVFFGPGASLDLRGAFVATTANSIRFGALGQFAADPAAGSDPQLLTVAPSALFFNQLNPAPIANAAAGLSVDPGQSLLLVGGNVTFDGGRAIAPGGRIGVAAFAQPTEVDLVAEGNALRLGVPSDFIGAPFALSNGGGLLTSSQETGGGGIEVRAGDITLGSNAELRAETFGAIAGEGIDIRGTNLTLAEGAVISTNTFGAGNGGDITVDADTVSIAGNSSLAPLIEILVPTDPLNPDPVEVTPEQILSGFVDGLFATSLGPGNAGNIALQVEALSVRDGAAIAATSLLPAFGGAGGSLEIAATESTAISGGSLLASGTTGSLPSGDLAITTPQLQVANSLLTTSTTGSGSGGSLTVSGADRIELVGELPVDGSVPISGGLFTATVGSGSAGNLTLETGTLAVRDGASATTSSLGAGTSGNLTVLATEAIELTAQVTGAGNLSASATGSGNGGNITVATPNLQITDGGSIAASTFGSGNGGNIIVDVENLAIASGGEITANTFGAGNSGNISIAADRADIVGQAPLAPFLDVLISISNGGGPGGGPPSSPDGAPSMPGGLLSDGLSAASFNTGNAGNISLNVGELSVRGGATISTSSLSPDGGGAGGQLDITATESVTIAGGSLLASNTSALLPSGDISLETPQLQVSNSLVFAGVTGDAAGGDINVRGAERIELAGSTSNASGPLSGGLFTVTTGSGAAGDVNIETDTLIVRNEGSILTSSFSSSGTSGNVTVTATEAVELSESLPRAGGASLSATAFGSGVGGDITVTTPRLTLRDGGTIASNTFGPGNGGDITVTANRVEITGQAPVAPLLGVLLEAFNAEETANDGLANLAPEQLLAGISDGLFAASFGPGNAGNIALDVGELALQNGATISATSFAFGIGGAGGQLDITATEGVTAAGGSLIASGAGGALPSGNLNIATPQLRVLDSVAVTAAVGSGNGGDIIVSGADFVELAGNIPTGTEALTGGLITATTSFGPAGDIAIDTGTLIIRDGASALTNSTSFADSGASGDLTIVATEAIELSEPSPGIMNANLSTTTTGPGSGGNIAIATPRLTLRNGGSIAANTLGAGAGGMITVEADNIEIFGTQPFVALAELFNVTDPLAPVDPDTLAPLLESGLFTIGAGTGPAGSIDIVGAETLLAANGATISTSTFGPSTAGSLEIEAADIFVQSSTLASNTFGPETAGDVTIATDRLSVVGGGLITATALNPGQSGSGGDLSIRARESIELAGTAPGSSLGGLLTTTAGSGDAGNIAIETQSLTARDGAQINSSTTNAGNGGNVTIRAAEIALSGTSPFNPENPEVLPSPSGISASAGDDTFSNDPSGQFGTPSGNAGNIDIDLLDGGSLTVSGGAVIATGTDSGTLGQGGSIDIDTGSTDAGAIVVEGLSPNQLNSTIATSSVGEGAAGTVTLRAGTVRLEDGGVIVAGTLGITPESTGGDIAIAADTVTLAGVPLGAPLATGLFTATLGTADAGDLTLEARQVSILDGALLTTSTVGTGNGGTLTLRVSDTLTVAGVAEDGLLVASLTATTLSVGDAGNLDIQVGGELQVTDNGFVGAGTINPFLGDELVFSFPGFGEISVPNAGTGGAGTATIAAETIALDNGAIGIATAGSDPSNANAAGLTLNVAENIFLFNGSEITAAALNNSNGGNININVSQGNIVLNQGSSITAAAATGDGGNIQIDTTGFFVCATCSVTASSSLGLDGSVEVLSPEVNPADSLVTFSTELQDSSAQIVTSCAAERGNRFAVVGRGGLPPSPGDRLQLSDIWVDLRDVLPTATATERTPGQSAARAQAPQPTSMQETVGWYRHENGDIELVAAAQKPGWQSAHPHCGSAAPAAPAEPALGARLP